MKILNKFFFILIVCGSIVPSTAGKCFAASNFAAPVKTQTVVSEADIALSKTAEEAKALYNSGTVFFEKADYDAAIRDLSASIALEPKSADTYYNRALAYRGKKMFDEAIADYTKAIEIYPAHAFFLNRCNAYIAKEDYDKAIIDGTNAITLSRKDPQSYLLRGMAYLFKGDKQNALADANRGLEHDPNNVGLLKLKDEAEKN